MAQQREASKDMEALIDLFMSPSFEPLTEKASQPNLSKFTFESEVDEDDLEEFHHSQRTPPFKHDRYFITKIGRTLAKCGDDFFKSYSPSIERQMAMGAPWFGISKRLEKVFLGYASITSKNKDPTLTEQEEQKAYEQFKDILKDSIQDTGFSDGYRQLGAFLLTVHGLSQLQEGVRGLARSFFSRYIRERELDNAVERMGGLDGLMQHELD